MIFVRIFLLLYVVPLMLISALTFIFGKVQWVKYVWIYGTLAVLTVIVAIKILFSIISLVE